MPFRRRARGYKRKPRRVMPMRRRGRILGFRTSQPTFTETYTGPVITPNSGGIFKFNIGDVPLRYHSTIICIRSIVYSELKSSLCLNMPSRIKTLESITLVRRRMLMEWVVLYSLLMTHQDLLLLVLKLQFFRIMVVKFAR